MTAPNLLSVTEAIRLMQEGTLSPGELLEACLRQIGRLNPKLNAFITVCSASGEPPGRNRFWPD